VNLPHLIVKNVVGNGFRSLAILICAAVVASLVLTATFVVRGAEDSLHRSLERLGADMLVLPWGTMTEKIGGIRLMSAAINGWMPRGVLEDVAAVEGVAKVSPQLYLATLEDSPYASVGDVFVVAYEPETDFALKPWLEDRASAGLAVGEAMAGARIVFPRGEKIALYGHDLEIVEQLEPTATSIDSTLFVSFETAERMIAWSRGQAKGELTARPGTISAIMVNAELESDPHEVAVRILEQVHGVVPLETPDLFQSERRQMVGVLGTLLTMLGLIWALTLVFMGLVFSVAANERRWDIGVLRALGFPRQLVLKVLLLEGAALAAAGGAVGVLISIVGFSVFGDELTRLAKLPLQIPPPLRLISLSLGGQSLALLSVTLAAFLPAWRISHQEVALTMRE
jgi:putative ABC transport system permease protein